MLLATRVVPWDWQMTTSGAAGRRPTVQPPMPVSALGAWGRRRSVTSGSAGSSRVATIGSLPGGGDETSIGTRSQGVSANVSRRLAGADETRNAMRLGDIVPAGPLPGAARHPNLGGRRPNLGGSRAKD